MEQIFHSAAMFVLWMSSTDPVLRWKDDPVLRRKEGPVLRRRSPPEGGSCASPEESFGRRNVVYLCFALVFSSGIFLLKIAFVVRLRF